MREYAWIIDQIQKKRDSIRREKAAKDKMAGVTLTDSQKKKRSKENLDEAVSYVLNNIPSDFVLAPFLKEHQKEVTGMLLTEYDEAEAMKLFMMEGERKGRKDGERKGRKDGKRLGERKMGVLMNKLFVLGRLDDAKKASIDEKFRKELYKEFNMKP